MPRLLWKVAVNNYMKYVRGEKTLGKEAGDQVSKGGEQSEQEEWNKDSKKRQGP